MPPVMAGTGKVVLESQGAAANLNVMDAVSSGADNVVLLSANDVNLAAIAEYWKGNARGHDTFVSFFISTGIGLGIVDEESAVGRTSRDTSLRGSIPLDIQPVRDFIAVMVTFDLPSLAASVAGIRSF